MPDDLIISGFQEIEAKLLSITSFETQDRIQRKALRAAGAVIETELETITPIRTTAASGRETPDGALKAAIRTHIHVPKDGKVADATVDFGKLTHIARFVDQGHANFNAKKGRTHTPAHPFIRGAEDASRQAAVDAYLTSVTADLEQELNQ